MNWSEFGFVLIMFGGALVAAGVMGVAWYSFFEFIAHRRAEHKITWSDTTILALVTTVVVVAMACVAGMLG